MMTGQARSSAAIMGLDTHMILETVPAQPSKRQNVHQAINRTSRHYAGALPNATHSLRQHEGESDAHLPATYADL